MQARGGGRTVPTPQGEDDRLFFSPHVTKDLLGQQVKIVGYVSRVKDETKTATMPKYLGAAGPAFQVNVDFIKKITCQAEYDAGYLQAGVLPSYIWIDNDTVSGCPRDPADPAACSKQWRTNQRRREARCREQRPRREGQQVVIDPLFNYMFLLSFRDKKNLILFCGCWKKKINLISPCPHLLQRRLTIILL